MVARTDNELRQHAFLMAEGFVHQQKRKDSFVVIWGLGRGFSCTHIRLE